MLVLTRKIGEQIVVPQCQLTVTVLDATPARVRLGIVAPANLTVHRREVCERINTEAALDLEGVMMTIRILVADPDEFLISSYREHFSQHGAVVATATNALTCLAKLREFAPDVLVLEPSLLWGGGDGLLALMHEEPEIRPASVLLLTQGGNRSLLYRLSPFKVDDYQIKPISPVRLMQRIYTLRRGLDAESNPRRAAPRSPSAVLPR
jgi:carbon storage regulator